MPKKTRVKRTETNWNLFVQQPDTQVHSDHADATKLYLKHIDRNFRRLVYLLFSLDSFQSLTNNARFTQELDPPDAQHWLKNITFRVIEGFLRWYLDNHNVEYRSSFLVFARFFRMYWGEEMRREFSYDLRRNMTMVCTILNPIQRRILTIEACTHHAYRWVWAWSGGQNTAISQHWRSLILDLSPPCSVWYCIPYFSLPSTTKHVTENDDFHIGTTWNIGWIFRLYGG